MFLTIFTKALNLPAAICCILLCSQAIAVTQYKEKSGEFVYDALKLKPNVSLPVIDIVEDVFASPRNLATRIKKSADDERIEIVHINVPKEVRELASLSRKLARANKVSRLYDYLKAKFEQTKSKPRFDGSRRVPIDINGFKLMNPKKLQKLFVRQHHNIRLDASKLQREPQLLLKFLEDLKPFFSQRQRRKIYRQVMRGKNISLEKSLLPPFARRMVRKFIVFRGPNCFHASLAFHGQDLTKSARINVKKENGYHRAMINYDELWRVLNSHFYEVDVDTSPLKYGDMIVFFELPKDGSEATYFRWIRHAATYLVGPYTFSKGSKSPDTPYTVKTMEDEWRTWRRFTKNLGVKVFRRNSKNVRTSPPMDLTDWIY